MLIEGTPDWVYYIFGFMWVVIIGSLLTLFFCIARLVYLFFTGRL